MPTTVQKKKKSTFTKSSSKRSRRPQKKVDVAMSTAKQALKMAKSQRPETKINLLSYGSTANNFGTGYYSVSPTGNLAIGTGEGQFTGNVAQMRSLRFHYRLQNARTGCPDQVRVLVVQFKSETVRNTDPGVMLDIANGPAAIHGGVDYVLAPKLRFTEDPAASANTKQYTFLYDKTHKLGSIDEGGSSIAEQDIVIKFSDKSGFYRRDVGTITSHEKNGIWIYFLGSDINRAAGVSSVDLKFRSQLRFYDN